MTLPAFAAERRAAGAVAARAPAAVGRYLLPARRSAANPPHAAGTDGPCCVGNVDKDRFTLLAVRTVCTDP